MSRLTPEQPFELATPRGPARVRVSRPQDGAERGLLCLGHGAGGGTDAPDLVAATSAAVAGGWTVARVDQPYRVAGRRAPEPAARLDEAWVAVVGALRGRFASGPLVVGGRSSGARVACRTALATGAAGALCLAFPLLPPRRAGSARAPVSRLDELVGAGVPVLVVQGDRDPFGSPEQFPRSVRVVAVPGDHSLRRHTDRIAAAVSDWLAQRVA